MIAKLRAAFTNGGLAKSGTQTVVGTAVFLFLSLISGAMIARLLGTSGRGETAAIFTLGQTLGWAVTLGCFQAIVFHNSRHPEDARANIGTWIALCVPLGIVGIVLGELLIGPLFREQSDQAVMLARLWILLIPLNPISEALCGALVATHDFGTTSALRVLQQVVTIVLFVLLWAIGEFTVTTVLLTQLVVIITYFLLLTFRTWRRIGFSRPRFSLAKSGFLYGVRAQFSNLGGQLNARLDILIMPAFLAASQIGLYAVAVSVSSMVVSLAGSLMGVALPVAARGGKHSPKQVAQMFHATMMMGVALALPVALLAPFLLELVYSSQFAAAGTALRLLAPGAVLLAMSNIVMQGLYGQNRPGTAGLTQLPGVVFTVVGLILFLNSGGIEAAAIISTITYGCSLLIASIVYLRRADIGWREMFDPRPTAGVISVELRRRIGGAVPAAEAGKA